jgi:hypothetical protein
MRLAKLETYRVNSRCYRYVDRGLSLDGTTAPCCPTDGAGLVPGGHKTDLAEIAIRTPLSTTDELIERMVRDNEALQSRIAWLEGRETNSLALIDHHRRAIAGLQDRLTRIHNAVEETGRECA